MYYICSNRNTQIRNTFCVKQDFSYRCFDSSFKATYNDSSYKDSVLGKLGVFYSFTTFNNIAIQMRNITFIAILWGS